MAQKLVANTTAPKSEPDDEAAEGKVERGVLRDRVANCVYHERLWGRPIRARPARIDDALRLGMQPCGAKRPRGGLGAGSHPLRAARFA